jgi:hypothetical protein
MDAAEPARRERADAGRHGQPRGRRHGGRPVAAAREDRGEVAHAALDDVVAARHRLQGGVVEPDARQAVRDDRALERHDGSPGGERFTDLLVHLHGAPP